jgi:hypothetical protein
MQSAMKGKACDILGPKKRRADADSNGATNTALRHFVAAELRARNDSITKQHTKGFGARPGTLSRKS